MNSGALPAVALLSLAVLPLEILAQTPPTTTAPGQIEREFQKPPAAPKQQAPVVPPAQKQEPPSGAEQVRFVLRSLVLEGSTVYKDADIGPSYAAYLNKEISLAQVFDIARDLTNKYRNDGYVLSQVVVPPQNITDGNVRLQAVEGYIARVDTRGTILGPRSTVDAMTSRIAQSRPLSASVLERNLLLLNDAPGVTARAILAPSEEPNASDLTVDVDQRRGDLSMGINNRGSRSLGPWRADVGGGLNSLLWGFDRLGLRLIRTVQNDELTYLSGNYDRLLGSNGLKLSLAGGYVDANPEPLLQNPDLPTNSISAGAALEYPFIRSRIMNLSGRTSFSFFNGRTDLRQVDGSKESLSKDNVRAVRVGLSYDQIDSLRGVNLVDLEASQGLKILNYSHPSTQSPPPTRSTGKPDFSKITLYAARLQSLFPRWSALVAATGQYAFNGLPAPEQFGVGGEQFGRAYDAAEILGDSGAAMKLELRFNGGKLGFMRDYMLYGFYDLGTVYLRNPQAGEVSRQSLASAGAGVRFTLQRYVTGYLEAAVPLTRQVAQEHNKDTRVFGGIQASF